MRLLRTCSAALTFGLLLGCGGEDPTEPFTDPRDVTYAAQLDIDLDRMTRTASGLYYENVEVGNGTEARAGTLASVYYSGWLPDGTLFDSRTSPPAFQFLVGIGQVIAGWDEGVSGMRVGGIRTLVVPPQLGYGNRRNGPIPANSVLVFRVELLAVN